MRTYTPRRASLKRWLDQAPPYSLDVFDNKGITADRYTVFFTGPEFLNGAEYKDTWIPYLGLSGAPLHPQGISMWNEMPAHDTAALRYAWGKQRIHWLDLPENVRKHVVARATT